MSDQYCIGSARIPGLSKLVEECGEVAQVAGKIIGLGSMGDHWDGTNLQQRLEAELGDLLAAVDYLADHNGLNKGAIRLRRVNKRLTFEAWHRGGAEPELPVHPANHISTAPGPVNCLMRMECQGDPTARQATECERCGGKKKADCLFFDAETGKAK